MHYPFSYFFLRMTDETGRSWMRNVFTVVNGDFICRVGVRAVKHNSPEAISTRVATDAQ